MTREEFFYDRIKREFDDYMETVREWDSEDVINNAEYIGDYKRIYDNSFIKPQVKGRVTYFTLKDVEPFEVEDKRVAICATIAEVSESQFTSKKTGERETFCKLILQQNNDICECVVWPEEYARFRGQLINSKNKIAVFSAIIKYSDYSGKNNLQFMKRTVLEVL